MNDDVVSSIILDTLKFTKLFADKVVLIKLGGSLLDNPYLAASLGEDIALLQQIGIRVIVVHGGGKAISRALQQEEIANQFIDGLRVTSAAAIQTIHRVLFKEINQQLASLFRESGVSCASLSGADDELLYCDYYSEQHGYVGVVKKVNSETINELIYSQHHAHGVVPIITPVGIDDQGNMLNINADWAASALASALSVDKLIYLTDQDGVYDANGQVISELNELIMQELIACGVIKQGMLAKANAIKSAMQQGIDNIHIINGTRAHALLMELFTEHGVGTLCKKALNKPVNEEVVQHAAAN